MKAQAAALGHKSDAGGVILNLKSADDVLTTAEPGFADAYITRGRDIPVRQVSLRQTQPDDATIYGDKVAYEDFIAKFRTKS